jgi:hypothetical protein
MKAKLLLVAATAAALAGCGGSKDAAAPPVTSTTSGTTTATTTAPSPSAPTDPVLAATSNGNGNRVFWADGSTLEPVDDRAVNVPFFMSVGQLSPDRSVLAIGGSETGNVQFVDTDSMETLGTVRVGSASYVDHLVWAEPDVLLASLGGYPGMVAAIDPATHEIVSEHDLDGAVLYSEPAGKELVSLVAPTDRIGPARLVVFDGSGLREVTLTDVPAGWEQMEGTDSSDYRARQSVPGLAVDPEGKRAVVIPAGGRVVEVDLDSMEVAYHDLSEPVSLWGRLRNWLEPPAEAKGINGPDRNAVWLPSGLIAVSGAQYTDDGKNVKMTPAGLALIDPSDWSIRRSPPAGARAPTSSCCSSSTPRASRASASPARAPTSPR